MKLFLQIIWIKNSSNMELPKSLDQVPSVTVFLTRAILYYCKAEFIILAVRTFFRFLMIPAELLFQTNIEGVSVGVAMEEKKFCPAGTSGGLI